MNRLLRKYNRILLAVFGVGLMIVFLMPQLPDLMSQFGGQGSLIATMGEDGEKVTREDWQMVQQQMQILQRMEGQLIPLPIIGSLGNDMEQYFLLVHEANEAGLIGGGASATINPDDMLRLSLQTGFPPAAIRQALINYSGIRRYLTMVASSGRLSDRRLRLESRRMLDGVDARLVVVPATAQDTAGTPTDTAMQAHFDTWGDVESGEGDHGFGYRLPDRVQMEWIGVPRTSIEAAIQSSIDANDIELRKYWSRNKARFAIDDDAGNGEVPDEVRSAFVQAEVDELRSAIARAANDALRTPRRGFESSENFLVLPDDWDSQRLPLEDLRNILAERFGLPLDGESGLPTAGRTESLQDLSAIAAMEGIGAAGTDRFGPSQTGARTRSLSDLLTRTREFGGMGEVPIQEGVAGPILDDANDGLWIFRITDTDPARPPRDVEEVRERVTTDLQRLADWERLQDQISAIEQTARFDGLDAVAEAHETTVRGPLNFQRNVHPSLPRSPQVSGLGQDQAVVDALIDASIALSREPLTETDRAERVVVVPSDRHMAVVIAELDRRRPLQAAQFDQLLGQGALAQRIISDEFAGSDGLTLADAFSNESLRARNKFERVGTEESTEEDDLGQVADAATDSNP